MHPTINQATREVIIEPSLTAQAQLLRTDDTVTTDDIDSVRAQLESIEPIEIEEQQMIIITQLQISQPHWQILQQSKQTTKGTFLLQAMLTQEEEVQYANASGDEPCSYQEAINSSKRSL